MLDDPFFYRPDSEGNLVLTDEIKQQNHRQKSFKHVDNWNTCIDIGANVGHWTRDLIKKFQKVIAFEPQKIFVECLRKNIDMSKVELYELGLSDKEEKTSMDKVGQQMYYSDNNFINCVTLDSFDFGVSIDYIKIDVDGYEYNVLVGGQETLAKQKNCVINIELKKKYSREKFKQSFQILKDLGYERVDRHAADYVFKKNESS